MRMLLLLADRKNCPDLFRQLAQFFKTQLVDCEDETSVVVEPADVILADVRTTNGAVVSRIRSILGEAGNIPRIALVNLAKHQEGVQARALGFSRLWNVDMSIGEALDLLKPLLGGYSEPDLPDDTPAATRFSVERLCGVLDRVALSAMAETQLPVVQAAEAVQFTLSAIRSDGIGEWLSAVQSHHSHTFRHSMLVSGYAIAFANLLGASAEEIALLGIGAVLHDVGKVRIPLSILDKPGKLTRDEFELVRKHPVYSREILTGRPEITPDIIDLAVHHHEYLDGSGYPDGLSGDEIGRYVRMLTICDIFSALTEERAYKKAFSPRQAYATLFEMGGKIDQDLLRQFRPVAFRSDLGEVRRTAAPATRTG